MDDLKRLTRITAILTQLQTKRLVTATALAAKFGVSVRTIYRDIRTLEQSGVPVFTEDGKGYSLTEGYRISPVTFTESEANALILAEQLVLRNRDSSFIKDYTDAIDKVLAVLKSGVKDKANMLAERTRFKENMNRERTSSNLSVLQFAITNFILLKVEYVNEAGKRSTRALEPFALVSTEMNWLLIAWCRTRSEFRFFRVDRIKALKMLAENFEPHNMTLQEYFEKHH